MNPEQARVSDDADAQTAHSTAAKRKFAAKTGGVPMVRAIGVRAIGRIGQICNARPSTARAASFTASLRLGWAWQVRATSSAEDISAKWRLSERGSDR